MIETSSELICWMIFPISAVMIGESPIDGSSSRSSFGRVIRARAMASICCSPPESEPASCRPRSRKDREMLIDHFEWRRCRSCWCGGCGYRKSYPGWRRCRDGLSSLWMLDLLKLLGGLLIGLFRSHAAREAETAFLRQQLVVLKRSAPARLRLPLQI